MAIDDAVLNTRIELDLAIVCTENIVSLDQIHVDWTSSLGQITVAAAK